MSDTSTLLLEAVQRAKSAVEPCLATLREGGAPGDIAALEHATAQLQTTEGHLSRSTTPDYRALCASTSKAANHLDDFGSDEPYLAAAEALRSVDSIGRAQAAMLE